mmetsp:Transcript_56978/g.84809  ORF Transcript_56978/g.84809 Transcript_56978/m.84809 type:complete len:372 (+) Transcript_56978:390-1505(+)
MIIKFDFSRGEPSMLRDELHPISKSPLIKDLVECHGTEVPSSVNLQLPDFIERSSMIEFCNFLKNAAAGDSKLGFGKNSHLSYRFVYINMRDYWEWAKTRPDPSYPMRKFLDWVEFYRVGSKPKSPETILPIAKYFQIDMCARCGILGSLDGLAATKLQPCIRTKWPKIPVVPDWEAVKNNSKDDDVAWREAVEKADMVRKVSGKVVCCNDDVLCMDCIIKEGCRACKKYECEDCKTDTESPKYFEEWHANDPDVYEDEYGRRGYCAYRALNVSRCLGCGGKICDNCGHQCEDCNRRACERCKEDLNTWCARCRFTIENNDDFDIGPIDRREYVCRECFYRRPQVCGCGEPSYDLAGGSSDASNNDSDGSY